MKQSEIHNFDLCGLGLLILVVCLALTTTYVSAGECQTAPSGLVSWWPGEGNANDITGTNNGTLLGGATANNAGVVGSCFSFDGVNGYVQIPDSRSLHPTNFTIEAWVLFSSLDSSGSANLGHQYIVFKQNIDHANFEGFSLGKDRYNHVPYPPATNGDVFYLAVSSSDGSQTAEADSAVTISTNVWYHVAAVRGPDFVQIYVNGQLQGQSSVSFSQSYSNLPVYIGSTGESYWDGKLNGMLDEVSLYNRALSSNEIAAVYNAGTAGKCKPPPVISITNVPAGLSVSNASFIVKGMASNDWQVSSVYYQLNATGWSNATTFNGTNWTAAVTLAPGTNTISIYAVDPSGEASPTTNASLFFAVTNQLQILTTGRGTISPNYSNAWLEVGRDYSITCAPVIGFAFINWTGGTSLPLMLLTNGLILQFQMESNLVLQANFLDVTRPTLSITTPTLNQQWSNGTFTATGKAGDNVAVASVYYSLNGSTWTNATTLNNWTNWSASLPLVPGTNTLQVYALDTSGNTSTTNAVSFEYVVPLPLSVQVFGLGVSSAKWGSLSAGYYTTTVWIPGYGFYTTSGWLPGYTNGTHLAVNENYTQTALPATGFAFLNWSDGNGNLLTNGPTLRFTMATNLALVANFVDVTRPTLSITTPTLNQQWTNGTFTATGKAGDNVAVASIYYSLNGGLWTNATTANNWTNWTGSLTLNPGTNTLQAFALDSSGNASTTNSVSFEYVVRAPLTVQLNGKGAISPDYRNTWLEIGANYSMTATPATGFVCTNWEISTDWLGGVVTNNATVQFMMQSNLTLQVNFAEVTKPVLTIMAPTAGQHMTNALAYVKGTAGDNWGVSKVWYQLNSNAWSLAYTTNSWTNWDVTLPLISGTNTLRAYAVDLGGNFSTNSSVSFVSSNAFELQLGFTMLQPLATNGLNFVLQVSTGLNGHVQVSTDLVDWITLTNFIGTNSMINLHDGAATNFNQRFYRAVVP